MLKSDLNPSLRMAAAIRDGDVACVRELLGEGCDVEQEVDSATGCAALSLAVQYHMTEIVALLIKRGALLDAMDREGNTALHYVARDGERAVLEILLEAGAAPNVHSAAGKTPLHLALALGSLRDCGAESVERVRLLLLAGADPDYVPRLSNTDAQLTYLTPLQTAFKRGFFESATELAARAISSPEQLTANGVSLAALASGDGSLTALLNSMRTMQSVAATVGQAGATEEGAISSRARCGPSPI